MNQKKKPTLTAMLLAVIFFFTACAAPASSGINSVAAEPTAAPAPWINSTIEGCVTTDTAVDVKDDFYMASNFDWISKATIPQGKAKTSAVDERRDAVQNEVTALLTDPAPQSHEMVLAQQFYKTYMDMDTRNALGLSPLLPSIEKIRSIKSIDALTQYLLAEDENSLVACSLTEDLTDSNRRAVLISSSFLSLAESDEYRAMSELGKVNKAALDVFFPAALMLFGYTAQEASAAWEDAFALEMVLAQDVMGTTASYQPDFFTRLNSLVTLDDLKQQSPVFPLAALLEKSGYGKSNILVLPEPEWLKTLNECYTEKNLEAMKSHLILALIHTYAPYLNQDFQDLLNAYKNTISGTTGVLSLDQEAYSQVNSLLGDAIGKPYIEKYFSDKTKANVEQMITTIMEVYRKRITAIDWLTEQTKQKALEKLDNMRVFVGYSKTRKDFSALTLKSVAEGGNLVEHVKQITQFNTALNIAKINTPIDKESGEILEKSHEVNAFYNGSNNSINIPAGILGGVFYDENGSTASHLGGIGVIIGHEITHAFDTNGSQFDKDGNLSNWWTDEDAASFKERTDKVAAYFGSFEVLPGVSVNGELVVTEATADLGGLSCILEIVRTIPNFDYEDFFASYAQIWRRYQTKENVHTHAMNDPHPPDYLRANAILQQFPEFYETYAIADADGMFLAPENRLSVW